jgi:hypothetical protein
MILSDYIKAATRAGDKQPHGSKLICYRTISAGIISHVHHAMPAANINWKAAMGKVYDWALVV